MTPGWQVEALIELVRLRYEAWTDFDHPPFVADEIEYKQKAVAQAAEWLNQTELDELIATEAFDTIVERLDKLARATNLLFLRLPSHGDTAVLHTAGLDKATFCTQLRNFLHADRPTPDRLQTFSDYLRAHDLPNKWPFPTYFLFLCHPGTEMFVKPRTAKWFLKFMGQPMPVSGAPDAATYAAIRGHVHTIKDALFPYGVHDMVDVQSMIWVGYSEAKERIGRLNPKGQIELGVPDSPPEAIVSYPILSRSQFVHESPEENEEDEDAMLEIEEILIPPLVEFIEPVFYVLKSYPEVAHIDEINNQVIEIMGFTEAQLKIPDDHSRSRIKRQLGFARTYLKRCGIVTNPGPKMWELTENGRQLQSINGRQIVLQASEILKQISLGEESKISFTPDYSLEQLLTESGYDEAELARWIRAIERKGQAVFYGPPGTGKTFIAERLARHLVSGGDGFVELVQFHPAYAYEDFMQGIRPFTTPDGTLNYDMVDGRFYTFCQNASQRRDSCVLIIDEINRANVAGVFGELMYLLEYRDQEIALAGGGHFGIPGNVRILATMNTADRSIALVDHALRRRFAFIHLPPNYDLLRHYHQNSGYDPTPLIRILDRLNQQINDPHYQLGTSFFMHPDLADQLEDIWRMEVEPYLEEYFFDQTNRIEAFRWQKIKKEIGY